jgi:hypothetical protein
MANEEMSKETLEIGETVVQAVILHQIGNRLRKEPLVVADKCFSINDSISNVILGGYLKGIVNNKNRYTINSENDLRLNDVFYHTSQFFEKKISFIDLSQKLATHLYTCCHHPNIGAGDLFIILFNCLKCNNEYRSAIGIYKSEIKQKYLTAVSDGSKNQLEIYSGINPDLIDKGALVVDGSEVIYAIDRLSSRTKYWIEDFLKAKQVPNENIKAVLTANVIEKIRNDICDPIKKQDFGRDILELCKNRDFLINQEIEEISEKYVSPNSWSEELGKLMNQKGMVGIENINISTKNLQKKLKKIFNQVSLGNDISLIIPNDYSLCDVNLTVNQENISINIVLEAENG